MRPREMSMVEGEVFGDEPQRAPLGLWPDHSPEASQRASAPSVQALSSFNTCTADGAAVDRLYSTLSIRNP